MKIRIVALSLLAIATIFVIAQSLPISLFPNVSTPLDSDLFVLAQTQAPKTNKNIRYDQLRGSIRSGMATETYVNSVSNAAAGAGSNLVVVLTGTNTYVTKTSTNGTNFYTVHGDKSVVLSGTNTHVVNTFTNGTNFYAVNSAGSSETVLWTNSGGIVMLTTNGPVSIASTGLLGGLVVTQDMRILGHNVASNYIWVATNATTGEGEWRDISALLSPVGINPRTNILSIQYEPVRGSTWYSGTNGVPVTNDTRAGFEFWPFWRALRMGELADGVHPVNYGGQATNYWNNTNMSPVTVAFGSNVLVRSAYSSIGGGAANIILTNSKHSVIAGGYNNFIDTNSSANTIGGGGFNQLYGRPTAVNNANRTIAGGSNNVINGVFTGGSFIGGGGDNAINTELAGFGGVAAGFANIINTDGDYAFIGGGRDNVIGDIPAGGGAAGEAQYAFVGGGRVNVGRGQYSVIVGGRANNHLARDNDYSFIGGGGSNTIGTAAGEFESKFAFIGGGRANTIANDATCSIIVGGEINSISGTGTNGFIGGGFANTIAANAHVATILSGKNNNVDANGDFGTVLGNSNHVGAAYAVAIGLTVTNSTAGSVTAGEFISYNTPSVISGAGSGSTNYLLAVTSPKMLLGSSNVHIYGVSGTIAGKTHNWSVNITNLSPDTWGIGFASGTNRWRFQSYMYGTSAPVVLTNNTLLRLNGASEGTNTLVTYEYFSPAL